MSQLQANVLLNLPKEFKTLVLHYKTYEKATFDQYLSASIALRSKNSKKANEYIDDITGKGSLNEHLKNLYSKLSEMDDSSLEKILSDSMFPITKIDKTNKYVYYPLFKIAVLNNKIYDNFETLGIEKVKETLMIDYDLIGMSFEERGKNDKYESYKIKFTDNNIEIFIANKWLPFDSSLFSNYCKEQDLEIERYTGIINSNVTGDDWNLLTANSFNSLFSSNKVFLDNDKNYCIITNDYIKKTEIANIHGLYFYRETRIDFINKNKDYCEMAIKSLLVNQQINETKTKTLTSLLKVIDDLEAQNVINYILARKESKEIALIGLDLIRLGLEKNWNADALISIKSYSSTTDLNRLYRINPNIKYSLSELALIDNDILTEEDLVKKNQYLDDRKNKILDIQMKLGEITSSGLRQSIKKVLKQSDPKVKTFTKYCNDYLAHNEDSLDKFSDEQLNNRYNKINEFYDNYLDIKKMYEEETKKK